MRDSEDTYLPNGDFDQEGMLALITQTLAHPIVIINDVLQENPFYVPPEEFLREVEARRPPAGSSAGSWT